MYRAVKVTIRSPMGVIDTAIMDEIYGRTAVDSDYGTEFWSPSCMLIDMDLGCDIRGLILSWPVICISGFYTLTNTIKLREHVRVSDSGIVETGKPLDMIKLSASWGAKSPRTKDSVRAGYPMKPSDRYTLDSMDLGRLLGISPTEEMNL